MSRPKLDVRIRMLVWEDHLRDRPSEAEYASWCEAKSAEYEVPVASIRQIVTMESESVQFQLQEATATEMQKLARKMGLTKEKWLRCLEQGLKANRSEVLKGEHGVSLLHPVNNKPRVFTQPDFSARAKYVDMFAKMAGAYAPVETQMNVQANVNVLSLSDDTLHRRLREIAQKVLESGVDEGVPHVAGGTGRAAGVKEPALLAPARNENEG